MQEIILWVLDHLNYYMATIFMAIESLFIPFPSEVVVPPAAWNTGSSAEMTLLGMVIFATGLGANIGALVNYYLAKFLGCPVVCSFARSRWGRYCLIDEAKVKYAEKYFVKNGTIAIAGTEETSAMVMNGSTITVMATPKKDCASRVAREIVFVLLSAGTYPIRKKMG